MSPKIHLLALVGLALAFAGCGKKETSAGGSASTDSGEKKTTTELVRETERSRHFLAVNRQLELGGTMYGYVDIDGDAMKVAGILKNAAQQYGAAVPDIEPFANQDFVALFTKLGLDDVKAFGVSSVPDGTGYFRNRAFFYTPDGRHGLLAGLGGKPGAFAHLALAPADTDIYSETEIDVPAIYLTVKDVVGQVAGEAAKNQLDAALQKAGEKAMISWLKLINATKGHLVFVMRFEDGRTFDIPAPQPVKFPAFSILMRLDGVGGAVEDALRGVPLLTATQADGMHLYTFNQPLPVAGLKPVIAIEGSTLFFATSPEFLTECRAKKSSLANDAKFKKALAELGTEGNGIGYISPHVFKRIGDFATLNPDMPPQVKSVFESVVNNLPKGDRPLMTLRVNLPDGILVRSTTNRSLKQEVALVAVYNPVTVGVLAAMAIPAFQKVRMASQQKAIMNNLRQLSAAADQFYLEKGVSRAQYEDLVGPGKYIKVIQPVMGENYRVLRFRSGEALRIRLPDGRTVEYQP